jgi:4-carboxymuconolactone decarboxylase
MNDQDHQEQTLATASGCRVTRSYLSLTSAEPVSGAGFRRLPSVHTFGGSWSRSALDDPSRGPGLSRYRSCTGKA